MDQLLVALRAAAEPTRLRLLVLCAHMDLTVTQLVEILGQSQPRVSRHLKLLSSAGLLERIRESGWVIYRIAQVGPFAELALRLVDAIDHSEPQLQQDLERLDLVQRARAEAALEYFNRNAPRWDQIRKLHVDEEVVERALVETLPAGPIDDVLDIGTGTGRILEVVSDRAKRAVGVDLSREMLNLARANLERKKLRNCRVQLADMYRLPMPNESVDVVTIHQVLHFASKPEDVIAEASRVLRENGLIALIDFAPHNLEALQAEHQHIWLGFDDADIARWADSAGLEKDRTVRMKGFQLTVCLWTLRHRSRPAGTGRRAHSRVQ
ncbi:MAG: metalloregulator ArsR/SmtB family transcription factor [Dongiaceae bacterium]